MPSSLVLTIDQTWDGRPAPEAPTTVLLDWVGGDLNVVVDAPFHDDPPPPKAELTNYSFDGLWNFEVVEVFLAHTEIGSKSVEYLEIEMSPHGHHLVLRFAGVRQRVAIEQPTSYQAVIAGDRWFGRMVLPWEGGGLDATDLGVNAFAIHGAGDVRRYLATFPLPGEIADFHQPDRFPSVSIL